MVQNEVSGETEKLAAAQALLDTIKAYQEAYSLDKPEAILLMARDLLSTEYIREIEEDTQKGG